MNPQWALVLFITELIMKYGIPAAIEIIGTWQIDHEPTLEEIEALRARVPHPSTVMHPPKEVSS